MNEEEVKALIRPRILGCTITEVEDFGDAFAIHFVNDEYYRSKNIKDLMIGAGPVIYIKRTGDIFETGSARSAAQYIQAYRECGDVYGKPGNSLEIFGLPEGQDKKESILNLKSILGLGITESKALITLVVREGKAEITLKSEQETEDTGNSLLKSGFKAKQLWENIR